MTTEPTRHRKRRRGWLIAATAAVGLVLVVMVVASITPWPSARLIRTVFEADAKNTVAEMERHVPDAEYR